MIKFTTQAGQLSIRGSDLDANFNYLRPLVSSQYGVNQTEAGWSLDIFPAFPEKLREPCVLGYMNGELGWYPLSLLEDPPPREADAPSEVDNTVTPDETEPEQIGDPVMIVYWNGNLSHSFMKLSEFIDAINKSEFGHEETVEAFNKILEAYTETTEKTWAIRTVERCDGKRMDVFGTDWYDPE